MARRGNLLDDVQIRRWVAKGAAIARSDGDGLTFTLSSAGTATWVLRYRVSGVRRKEITLGNYPDLTLAAARKLARERRVDVDQGKDPAADKKVLKMRTQMAWTVRELISDYKEKKLTTPPLAEGTVYYRKWDLDKIIGPKLGSMCPRRSKSEPLCRSNIEPGLVADQRVVSCG